jgi:ribonuclease HI
MVFPVSAMESITAALVAAHSYEEPAYDIYPLATRSHAAGAGRMGSLALHPRLDDFAASVAASFGMEKARYSGNPESLINKAAVVTGSGAGYIREASGRAEVLVTGDFRYHDLIMAQESGLALVEVPHDVCELEALKRWAPQFGRRLASMGIKIRLASTVAGRWRSAMAASASGNEEEGPGGTLKKGENSMYDLHVDGGARGNPGPAGIGVVLSDSAGSTVASISEYIGEATNNVAEYRALIEGLKLALERGARDLRIYSDSELVVRQLGGSYKVKNEGLRPYYEQAKELLGDFTKYELISIPREKNNHADDLVNHALDEAGH